MAEESKVEKPRKTQEERDKSVKRLLFLGLLVLVALLIIWYGLNIGWALVFIVGGIVAKMTGAA